MKRALKQDPRAYASRLAWFTWLAWFAWLTWLAWFAWLASATVAKTIRSGTKATSNPSSMTHNSYNIPVDFLQYRNIKRPRFQAY